MPFSDPMADGPVIQLAGQRALKAGQTLTKTLAMVAKFREADDATPIVLMGYYNPIYSYGVDAFIKDALAAGVDGLILVDMPPEEDGELCVPALKAGLNFIRLTTPTTDDRRLPAVLKNTSGFVYYVSMTGITGAVIKSHAAVGEAVKRIKSHTEAAGRGRLRHQDGGGRSADRPRCRWRCGRNRALQGDRRQPRGRQGNGADGTRAHGSGRLACGRGTAVARLTTSSKRVTFPVCR